MKNPDAALSALMATDAINLLGERDLGQLGSSASDDLAHLLANYIVDVDLAARYPAQQAPLDYGNLESSAYDGLPPGARFDSAKMHTVLTYVLRHPDAVTEIAGAARILGGASIAAAIDEGPTETRVEQAVVDNAKLAGYIVGATGYGTEASSVTPQPKG